MAAITAIYEQCATDSPQGFEAVHAALGHRGPDGADAVATDGVALGHQHFYTTPEEVGESQPVGLGDLWITFDGRIDNRTEVIERLDGDDAALRGRSDAHLALRAYRDLGESFLESLVGAFALAIWDPGTDRLLVARDKTGIRKLYYADCDDVVVVASEIQALVEHPAVTAALNEGFVGELLASYYVSQGETFFRDVRPVEAGSFLEVTADGVRSESYWEPWNATVERDPSKDVAEEFLDRLEAAVVCRLRSPEVPGVMMSGGLDSTAIACVARRHLDRTGRDDADLHAYSLLVDGDDDFDEEVDRIDAVVEACDLNSHRLRANDHFVLKDVETYERHARESPVFSPVIYPSGKLFERAAATGRRAILAGIAGNVYDGSRLFYLDLVREGRIATFVRHALADPMPLRKLLLWYVLAPSSDRVADYLLERNGADGPEVPAWMAPGFVERSGLADRLSEDIETGIDSAAKQQSFKRYFRRSRPFEDAVQRRVALEAGVELRCPYLDSRLVSFLVSIPPETIAAAGRDKALFRRALEGVLPETVRTQDAAVTFDVLVDLGIQEERVEYVEELFADSRLVDLGIVEEAAFESHVAELLEPGVGRRRIWDLISMELWLREWT